MEHQVIMTDMVDDDVISSYLCDQYSHFSLRHAQRPSNPEPGAQRTTSSIRQPATLSRDDDDLNPSRGSALFLANDGTHYEQAANNDEDTDFLTLLTSACS